MAVLSPFEILSRAGTLDERLRGLHRYLLECVPSLDRIACALYDAGSDTLKTFINSTREGEAIVGYEFRLADSPSLSALVRTGDFRVLDDIPETIRPNSEHSIWLLRQGYRSSFTAPMFGQGALLGFVFFDSLQPHAFSLRTQRDLALYSGLLNMAIASELATVRSLVASARVARDFAQLRDFETGAHLERMARYARLIARHIAPARSLTDEFVEHVFQFAPLHDIGKIGIPDRILLKPGKLDVDERAIMQTHVVLGNEIIGKIIGDFDLARFPDSAVMRNIVACHHEMLDGSGYPRGLAGDAVPVEARIIAVADIFDALTSARPYKPAWPVADALAELERMAAAGKLDAGCVEALTAQPAEVADILTHCRDAGQLG